MVEAKLEVGIIMGSTYDTVHMPPAHMSTDGCEALSAHGPKWCEALSAVGAKGEKSTVQMATFKIY